MVAQPLDHGERDRVPATRLELVDVERGRRARIGGGREMPVLLLHVEGKYGGAITATASAPISAA